MATLIIVTVAVLFLGAILTGGYNQRFLDRVKNSVVWDYITTVDHKKIAHLYYFAGIFYFVVGGIEALLIRTQLISPGSQFLTGDAYNQVITMHGTTMIFFAAMPLFFGLMNAILPLQIGARDVAFPFLNNFGFWLFFFGALLTNLSWFLGGAPDAGWTSYTSLALNEFSPGPGIDYYVLGLQISGIGTLISAINFIVTVINMRAPGMTFLRMPMFTWTTFVSSLLILFAFPALTVGLLLLMFDRLFGSNFFDHSMGGSHLIWQHLFWIFGHPEVYIVILPAFGIISDVVSTFSKKRLFGYNSMVFATAVIGFLGFMVWVHHMFTVGLGPVSNSIFGVATMAIAVPTGIKVFNWLFTMWGGEIRFNTAMLFALGFIPTFVMGGVTGVMVALPAADFQFQDSYFVVAHFHYTLVGGTVMAIFAGSYYWWPKMFGRKLNETLGKWHFWTFLIGFHLTFLPQHWLGLFGMPRRVFTYNDVPALANINLVSSIGVIGMAVGTLIFAINILQSFMKKADASADPWNGRTLEWAVPSPAPVYNFKQLPLIRAFDQFWVSKQTGKEIEPAEPLGSIHMPSSTYLPFLMSLALFIAGFGFITRGFAMAAVGLILFFITMYIRSYEHDPGYHIEPEQLKGAEKEAKA